MTPIVGFLGNLFAIACAACFSASLLLMVFWYLPAAFRFKSHARQYDRDAFDQAGFDDEGYPDDKGAFRRFIHMRSYERLKDPRSRELAGKMARGYKVITRLIVACIVFWVLGGIAAGAAHYFG